MVDLAPPDLGFADLYITDELDRRQAGVADCRQEMLAILELAGRMADEPEAMLPRFVDLAMEITGASSAGISIYEPEPAPGVFRWSYLRGQLARFEGALTPRHSSPCGVTLDHEGPVLCRHPERAYDWIAAAEIVVPEVLLVPVYIVGTQPFGTLWIVAASEPHFSREHARAMTELASFVGVALRMLNSERKLLKALEDRQTLADEMAHRVKNMFAVAEGLLRLSARDATDKTDLVDTVSGRLQALATAHSLVSRHFVGLGSLPRTEDLAAVLRAVIAPYDVRRMDIASKLSLAGPVVVCGPQAINGLALIFHELATNAAKYGALAVDDGCVDVRWSIEGDALVIAWDEQGGPSVVAPPTQEGFGSALIKRTIAGQFAGSLSHAWGKDGLSMLMHLSRQQLAA
jgi:two-component sensor histidine kinase